MHGIISSAIQQALRGAGGGKFELPFSMIGQS